MKRLIVEFALESGRGRYGDLEPSGELRVEEELEEETRNFGLSEFRGFSKAFPNPCKNYCGSAIKSDPCRCRYDEMTAWREVTRDSQDHGKFSVTPTLTLLPAPAFCFRRDAEDSAARLSAFTVSAGLVGGGIRPEKEVGNPPPQLHRAGRIHHCLSIARVRGLPGREPRSEPACSPHH